MTSTLRDSLKNKTRQMSENAVQILVTNRIHADNNKSPLVRTSKTVCYSLNDVSKMPKLNLRIVKEAMESLKNKGHEFDLNGGGGAAKAYQMSLGDVRMIYDECGIETHQEMKARLGLSPEGVVIAMINLKGGVGKTTASASIGAGLTCSRNLICQRLKVLIIDMDPQGSTSMAFGFTELASSDRSAISAVMEGASPEELESWILKTNNPGLDLLAASTNDAFFNLFVSNKLREKGIDPSANNFKFNELLEEYVVAPLRKKYDVIIFDCAPTIETSVINVLHSADGMLIPFALDPFDFDSTLKFITRLPMIFQSALPKRMDEGKIKFMASKMDETNIVHRDNYDTLNAYYSDILFNSHIPQSRAFSTTINNQETIYDVPKKYYQGDIKSLNSAKAAMDRVVAEVFHRFITVGASHNE